MLQATSRKFFATFAIFLLSTCGQKEKGSSNDATQCPESAGLLDDACATGVQAGKQPDGGQEGGSPDPVIPVDPTDPIIPDLPVTPTPEPTPTPTPTPGTTDGTDNDDSSDDDSGSDDSSGDEGAESDNGNLPLEPLHYTVSPPVYTAAIYADTELEARTLLLEHDADLIACSSDGGSTFIVCAGDDRHIFSVEDYRNNVTQVVRFTRTDGVQTIYEDYSYRPQTEDQPSVRFIVCDYAVTANDSIDVISKLFSSASDSNKDGVTGVCFEQGLTISTNTNFTIGVNHLWLIGHSTNRPLILNANNGSSVAACGDNRNRLFLTTGKSFALVNLNLQTKGCRGSVLEIIGTQNMDFLIENSLLSALGDEGDAVSILSTKGNTTGQVRRSMLSALGSEQRNFFPNGIAINQVAGNIRIDLANSEIRSTFDNPIHLVGGSLTITNSLIQSTAAGSVGVHSESSAGRNANIFIQDSILKAESFGIVQKTIGTTSQLNTVEVNRTRFNAAGTSTKVISFQGEPSYRVFNSSLNENHACSDTGRMIDWLSGKPSSGSFVVEKQSRIDADCDK
jgi:hypothetical protein